MIGSIFPVCYPFQGVSGSKEQDYSTARLEAGGWRATGRFGLCTQLVRVTLLTGSETPRCCGIFLYWILRLLDTKGGRTNLVGVWRRCPADSLILHLSIF